MGKLTLDGTEQLLFESTDLGEYSGYVFLNTLQAGNTVVIYVYIKDVEAMEYFLLDSAEFAGVQSKPVVRIAHVVGKVGIKVTVKQTAGTYRTINHMWFKK